MRKNLLYVAVGMAGLVLMAQVDTWRRVSVYTPTTVSNVTNITFVGNVTAAQFVGGGAGLTGVLPPSGTNGLTGPTNNFWDVDTITAPATSGSVVWDDPGYGQTYNETQIEVWPIYSNAIGRVFGTALSGQHNETPATYHRWTWDAQPGAVAYFVHVYIPELSSDNYTETAGLSVVVDAWGGVDVSPKPSSVNKTNEVLSSFYATAAQLAGATAGVPVNPVLQSSNWTAYADPQFPTWSPPYFGNIGTALHWLAQGPTGTRTNHAILKITGMHRLSGPTFTVNDDGLDFLYIDAGESTIFADVSQCGAVKGVVTLGSSCDHVQVKGGKWIGHQDSNKNGMALKLEGKYCGLVGVDGITSGSNWNATSAITVDGYMPYMIGCMSRISTNSTGSGNYNPLIAMGSTALIMNCVFDLSQKPNSYFHLGQDQGKKAQQFIDCKFKFITSGTQALFSRVSANAKWINCVFANATNTASQTPVIGRVGDVATTNFVINCVFNQANWWTNCIMVSNNVSVADETTGFDGVLLTPPD